MVNNKILLFLSFVTVLNLSEVKAETVHNNCQYGYSLSFQYCIQQTSLDKTQAEIEHGCAKEEFDIKLKELNKEFDKVVALYNLQIQKSDNASTKKNFKEQLKNLSCLQKSFLKHLNEYGKSYSSPFLRTKPFHFYGSMIDLINVRINHLHVLSASLNGF